MESFASFFWEFGLAIATGYGAVNQYVGVTYFAVSSLQTILIYVEMLIHVVLLYEQTRNIFNIPSLREFWQFYRLSLSGTMFALSSMECSNEGFLA